MHCHTACGLKAMAILQCNATLIGDNRGWSCYNALPRYPGFSGQGTYVMHCHTGYLQWVPEIVQCTATLLGGSGQQQIMQCTAALPSGSGLGNSCNALPRCVRAQGSGNPAMPSHTALGQ